MPSLSITWSLMHTSGTTAALALTCAALSIATLTDLRGRKIPNLVTFPVALCGLVLHGLTSGGGGLLSSALAAAIWLVGGFLFWSASAGKGIGAGDVKLATTIAALLGFWPAFWVVFFGNLAQVMYLFLRWIVQGTLLRNAVGVGRWLYSLLAPGTQIVHFEPVGMEDKTPHAPFLLLGTVLFLALSRYGALPW